MSFRKSGLLSNTFLADADGFVPRPRIKHGELFKIFSRCSLVVFRRKSSSAETLSSRPTRQLQMLQLLNRFLSVGNG